MVGQIFVWLQERGTACMQDVRRLPAAAAVVSQGRTVLPLSGSES
jgi:hypothetical protein